MNNKVEHVQTFNHKSQGIFSSNGKKKSLFFPIFLTL